MPIYYSGLGVYCSHTVQILGMLGYGTTSTAVTGKPPLCGNGHCVYRVDVVWGAYDQLPHVPVAPTPSQARASLYVPYYVVLKSKIYL
jgi:hypothetical protein